MGIFFAAIFVLAPWVMVLILRQRLREQTKQFEQRFQIFTERLYAVESALRESRASAVVTPAVGEPKSAAEPERPPAAEDGPQIVEFPRSISEPTPAAPAVDADGQECPSHTLSHSQEAAEPAFPAMPYIPPRPAEAAPPPPIAHEAEAAPSIAERIRSGGGIEEVLGKNWLNKVGIVLLVLGIAFFLQHQLVTMGPAGKILVGYLVSAALLGAGVWVERNQNYRILARAGISGGWALLFFSTYAMYHVPAAQVLSSQLVDLVLMLIVALAMVAHTLRYNSQAVTGMAFLLAYLTIFVSRVNVYSLTAGVVLALGIAIIAVKRNWLELEVFGILATYLNHYFWLRTIIEPMGGQRHPFPEFFPSAAILVCYWAIYRTSYIVRRIENQGQENVSTIAVLLNTSALLLLLRYQSMHPEWAFWALLVLGAVELILGQLPITKRRRTAFVELTSIGATLMVAAIPFRYSGGSVSVLWLTEAEALFLAGLFSEELVFTRLGSLAGIATAGQMIGDVGFKLLADRLNGQRLAPEYGLGLLVLGLGAAVLYCNAHWFPRKWNRRFASGIDWQLVTITSFVAAALAAIGLWMAFPDLWTAVAWSILAMALALAGKRRNWEDFAIQANLLSAAALIRVIVVNLGSEEKFDGVSLRLITVAIVAALYYITSRWTAVTFGESKLQFSAAYTWTASVLVALLIWFETPDVYIALLWCLFGLVLFQIGLRDDQRHLRWQAYLAIVCSFFRMFAYNIGDAAHPGDFSARVYSVIPVAIVCYCVFANREAIKGKNERTFVLAQAWIGTVALAALTWYETPTDWAITAWAALTFLLLAVAFALKLGTLMQQGMALSVIVLLRAIVVNFDNLDPGWSDRSLAVASASAVLFASLYFCFRLMPGEGDVRSGVATLFEHPEQPLFFVPLAMVTILLALEMRHGLITVSWGIEGVLVFLFALMVNERSYRLSGLGLLLLCVGKVVLIDVWGLNSRDRYITFIIMGCALLLVSFLYTRHRDTIKQYL